MWRALLKVTKMPDWGRARWQDKSLQTSGKCPSYSCQHDLKSARSSSAPDCRSAPKRKHQASALCLFLHGAENGPGASVYMCWWRQAIAAGPGGRRTEGHGGCQRERGFCLGAEGTSKVPPLVLPSPMDGSLGGRYAQHP